MTPGHQFTQLPTAYYRELQIANRQKAIAFLEYAVDDFSGDMESDRHYGRLWGKSSSTSKTWIEDFRDAIKQYHLARINFSNQNAEKTKQKKPKNSRTSVKHQSNTCRTEVEYQSNTLTIEENVEIESIGGEIEKQAYLEFRLSGENIFNPKGLEIIIFRDLSNPGSKESKDFFEWQKIKNESQYILGRLIVDFVEFGRQDRKMCQEIFNEYEKNFDRKDLNLVFQIAFFKAKKLISERSRRTA
jgi:hypothetical protein